MSKSKYCICVGTCVQHEIWENKSKPSFELNGKQKLGTICQITKHTIEKLKQTKNMSKEELTFDEWYDLYEDEINIELAENGADREMDFDPELEFEKRYQEYMEEIDISIDDRALQKQYIIERMDKYLMKYSTDDLLDLYLNIKEKAYKK